MKLTQKQRIANVIIAAGLAAVMATEGFATPHPQPPKEPPQEPPVVVTESGGGSNAGVAIGLLAVLTLVVLHSNKPDPEAPRPPVDPEPDFEKLLEEAGN